MTLTSALLGGLFLLVGITIGWLLAMFKYKKPASGDGDLKELKTELDKKAGDIIGLNRDLSAREADIKHLTDKLNNQQKEIEKMYDAMLDKVESMSKTILEERREEFEKSSERKIGAILDPIKTKFDEFNKSVNDTYSKGAQERASLKTEIESLVKLNQTLSQDANNLANAIKGEVKIMGNWGEEQLEKILQNIGLQKGTQYEMRETFTEDGHKKQPDCIIKLPDDRCLIIDSKVSLVAYEAFFNAADTAAKDAAADGHVKSIETHVKELSGKKYEKIHKINNPDYVLMFVPIEGAIALAENRSKGLFSWALDQNVVMVSASSLLATLKTVAYMWKQEGQKKNIQEIADRAGDMLDKFADFVKDLTDIGTALKNAEDHHADAMNKLTTAKKPGDTLIGKARKIQELGVVINKKLPPGIDEIVK